MIPTVFPERVQCRLHPERADWGEWLQHVRIFKVEEQEEADVCGFECPWKATEREENPQEEHGHPLPPNCGVKWRTQLEKEDMQHWTERFLILKKSCKIKTFTEKSLNWKQGTNTVTQKYHLCSWLWLSSCTLFGGRRWSVFSVARDAIFILFFSVPNSLQLEFVCNVDNTGDTVPANELW